MRTCRTSSHDSTVDCTVSPLATNTSRPQLFRRLHKRLNLQLRPFVSFRTCGSVQKAVTVSATAWSDLLPAFQAADELKQTAAKAIAAESGPPHLDDTVTRALEQMQHAVAAEDYETAAKLRDTGLPWLGGWWRPAAAPGLTSSSTLLHVAHTEPNRWTGLLFTPADFMHFDLLANCQSSELQMADMLQDSRYGTPLFEVFVLPQQQQQQQQQQQAQDTIQQAADNTSRTSSDLGPVVVALQSANRAFNELLGVQQQQQGRRRRAAEPDEPSYTNQRLLLLVEPHQLVTAAAVHAGCNSTLCTWHISYTSSSSSSSSSSTANSSSSGGTSTQQAPGTDPSSGEQPSAAGAVCGPFSPAESSGGCRRGLTVDGNTLDFLRGPGTLQRTSTDTFTFARQPLPADILSTLTGSNGSCGGGWDGSNARLFRVDLQYQLPPACLSHQDSAVTLPPLDEAATASSDEDDEPAAAAAAVGAAADEQSSHAAAAAAGGSRQWAERIAAELCRLLAAGGGAEQGLMHPDATVAGITPHPHNGSSSDSSLTCNLAALLAAAADGSAPPKGVVSEQQQAVSVVEVPVSAAAAADEGDGGGSTAAASPAAAMSAAAAFTRVVEPTTNLSFGGWKVTACL